MEKGVTSVELYAIEAVRKKRLALGIDAKDLSLRIGVDGNWVGKVENPKEREKYNLNHLHEIAKVLECPISDFLPDPPLQADCLAEYQTILKNRREKAAQ